MKRRIFFNLLAATMMIVAALAGTLQVAQGSGGPDEGGYIFEDSNDPGGPVYSFDDIATTGTALTLTADGWSGPLAIGFPFEFYGTNYDNVYVSANGLLTFRSDQLSASTSAPQGIPSGTDPDAIIAGWWANLNPTASGASVRWQVKNTAPNRVLIVQFTDVPHVALISPPKVTFQFKLFEGSNNIEIHYKTMSSDGNNNTIGIENADGTIGLQYSNGPDNPADSFAIRYSIFVGLAARPSYQIKYGPANTVLSYTVRISNWTGFDDTFTLALSGNTWETKIDGDDWTVAVAQGKWVERIITVTIPPEASPGDYSQATIVAGNGANSSYSETMTIVTAVPRRGYGLGYENTSASDALTAIVPVDTKFHNTLGEAFDASNLGPFINYGTISPDGNHLWVAASGETNKVFDLNLPDLSTAGEVVGGGDTSDVAFTADGKTAIITSYGDGNARVVDVATHAVTSDLIATGTQSIQVATSPCLPRKAYVTNLGTTTVSVVNMQAGTSIKNISGFNKPHGIAISPTQNRAYVANSGAATIGVIDTFNDTLLTSWNIGGSSMAGLDITPDGKYLVVASSAVIKIVDTSDGAYWDVPSPIDNLWEVETFPEGKGDFAYVTSKKPDYQAAVVINPHTRQVVKLLESTWSPVGLALFPMETKCNLAPAPSFTYSPQPARNGDAITFTNTSINAATKYTWNFGDGSAESNEEHPTHTYTDNGPFTVTLTAENENGSNTASTTINLAPRAIFEPVESIISPGATIDFINKSTGTNGPNGFTYTWNFGDGSATSSDVSPSHTYTSIGDWTVQLTVKNDYGTDTATGKVDFPSAAAFEPVDPVIQLGDPITFTNKTTGSGTLTYAWDFGDGVGTSSEASPTYTYQTAGSYTVTLNVTSQYGNSSATTMVNFKPRAVFEPPEANIKPGDIVTFSNKSTGTPELSYIWDFGDGTATSTETNPQHQYANVGDYTVTLTAKNAYGEHSATGKVGFAPVAGFNQSATNINLNDTVTFTNTTTGTNSTAFPMTYQWNFGDGATSTDTSPSHQYTTIGNYTVTLTATNHYGTSSKTGEIHFVPAASFTQDNDTIQTGDMVTFTNTSTGSPTLEYTWNFGDGSATSTETSPKHQYTTAGDYTVTLSVHNTWGDSQATGRVVFRPRAAFKPDNINIHLGDPIQFTNQSTGTSPLKYTWDFNDGTTSSLAEPSHTYTVAKDYTVKLTVENAQGKEEATGAVHFLPTAAFAGGEEAIKVNDSITFTNQSVGSGTLTYNWTFGDGATSTQASPTHQYTTAGTYTVTLTVTNPYGSGTATRVIHFKPTAAIEKTTYNIQTADTINFVNKSMGTEPLTYQWDFGDGASSTGANPSHRYDTAAPDRYTVTLRAHNQWGDDSATAVVVFKPRAIFTPTSSIINVNKSINFSSQSTGSGTLSYTWDFGDGSPTSNLQNPSHLYTTTGDYSVQLTVANANGTDTAKGTVVFYPTAGFNADRTVIYPGEAVHFTNTSVGSTPLTYSWKFGDGGTSTDPNPTHTYTTAGSYQVTLTATNKYGSSEFSRTITFFPTASFTITPKPLHVGDTVSFTNTSTGTEQMDYSWNFGDGATSTATSPSHTYVGVGPYTVTLTAHNLNGTDTETMTVGFAPTARFGSKDTVIKLNEMYRPENQSIGTEPLGYTWKFGDGQESHEKNPSHPYAAANTYSVSLTVQNEYGTDTATGTVAFSPVTDFDFSPAAVFPGDTVYFTSHSTGTATLSYAWDFGDGTTSTLQNPVHIFGFGRFTVKLTVTNAQGSDTMIKTVSAPPNTYFFPLIFSRSGR